MSAELSTQPEPARLDDDRDTSAHVAEIEWEVRAAAAAATSAPLPADAGEESTGVLIVAAVTGALLAATVYVALALLSLA
jgi:hypothetical protein